MRRGKKSKSINPVVPIVLAACIVLMVAVSIVLYLTSTPKYALLKTIKDVNASGMEGLKPHLTDDVNKTVSAVAELADNAMSDGLIANLTKEKAVSVLKTKMSDVDWTVEDVLKGKKKTEVVIGFNYKDSITGTIDITMVKEEGKWKIDGLGIPHFESLSLW